MRASILVAFGLALVACDVENVQPDSRNTTPLSPQSNDGSSGGGSASTGGLGGGTSTGTQSPPGDLPPGVLAPVSWSITPNSSAENTLINAISAARESVRVGMYLFTENGLRDALIDAAARIPVTLVIDNSSQTASYNAPDVSMLAANGVNVVYAVGVTYHHAKYMVVDSTDAYVMTSNWTYSSFNSNREVLMRLDDPTAVADLVGIFDADAAQETPSVSSNTSLVVSPFNSREKIAALVTSATQTLWIAIEEAGDDTTLGLIADRVAAGVDVRVLLADPSVVTGNTSVGQELIASGASARYLPSPYLHEKIIMADGLVFCGSENLSSTSLDHNREVGLIANGAFLAAMHSQFEADWQDGVSF